jgi:hypothetical protein
MIPLHVALATLRSQFESLWNNGLYPSLFCSSFWAFHIRRNPTRNSCRLLNSLVFSVLILESLYSIIQNPVCGSEYRDLFEDKKNCCRTTHKSKNVSHWYFDNIYTKKSVKRTNRYFAQLAKQNLLKCGDGLRIKIKYHVCYFLTEAVFV